MMSRVCITLYKTSHKNTRNSHVLRGKTVPGLFHGAIKQQKELSVGEDTWRKDRRSETDDCSLLMSPVTSPLDTTQFKTSELY